MTERTHLIAALEWQLAAGADEAVGEVPVARFASGPQPGPAPQGRPAPTAAPADGRPRAAVGPCGADGAGTLDELRRAVLAFEGCGLKKTATNTVFGEGPEGAALMIIGEAPGADEDRQGRPFVGVSGQLLERMLAAIGLVRTDVYITNTLYWRPPGNRDPSTEEIAACRPFTERQIALVAPRILVALGAPAAKTLLQTAEGIMKLRGRWMSYEGSGLSAPIDLMPMFHPAFLLRSPARKREAWRDLLAVRARLDRM